MWDSTAVLLPEDYFSFALPALVVKVTPTGYYWDPPPSMA